MELFVTLSCALLWPKWPPQVAKVVNLASILTHLAELSKFWYVCAKNLVDFLSHRASDLAKKLMKRLFWTFGGHFGNILQEKNVYSSDVPLELFQPDK